MIFEEEEEEGGGGGGGGGERSMATAVADDGQGYGELASAAADLPAWDHRLLSETSDDHLASSGSTTPGIIVINPDSCLAAEIDCIRSRRSSRTPLRLDIPVACNAGSMSTSNNAPVAVAGAAPKSPINVQEWVDSIDVLESSSFVQQSSSRSREAAGDDHQRRQKMTPSMPDHSITDYWIKIQGEEEQSRNQPPTAVDDHMIGDSSDNLGLGAEARHLEEGSAAEVEGPSSIKRKRLVSNRENSQSFQSEVSATSTTSSVSIFLETMRDDPEEILTNLGFGDPESCSPFARIPYRFLMRPSTIRGNDLAGFLKRHEEMQEINDTALSGYLGLAGYRSDGHSPSGIVSKILEKILERNRELKQAQLNRSVAAIRPSFFQAAYSVMAVNAFRNSIRSSNSNDNNSILEPNNRKSRESRSTTAEDKRSRRLVLGKHSLTVNSDEELIDDDPDVIRTPPTPVNDVLCMPASIEVYADAVDINPTISGNVQRQMSDDVFLPNSAAADKRRTMWKTVHKPTPNVLIASRSQSLSELDKDEQEDTASNRRSHYRRNRQYSVHDESVVTGHGLRRTDFLNSTTDQHRLQVHQGSPRVTLDAQADHNKESFELEELPTTATDLQEWNEGGSTDGSRNVDFGDAQRTGSALSVSSGFLEYEGLDVTSLEVITPSVTLENEESSSRRLSPSDSVTMDHGQHLDETVNKSSSAEAAPAFEFGVFADASGVDATLVSKIDSSLSVDEKIAQADQVLPSAVTWRSQTLRRRPSSAGGAADIPDLSSPRLSKSQSETNLSCDRSTGGTMTAVFVSSGALSSSPEKSRLFGIGRGDRVAALTRFWSNVGSDSRLDEGSRQDKVHAAHSRLSCESAGTVQLGLDKSYSTEMARMRDVVTNYAAQLRDAERSCWETYHRLFPGLTPIEKSELRKLSELRRRILKEASRTSSLLHSNRLPEAGDMTTDLDGPAAPALSSSGRRNSLQTSDKVQLAGALDEHVSSTSDHLHRLRQTLICSHITQLSTYQQMKQEILREVKQLLRTDQNNFLQAIHTTRRQIQEVKEVVAGLMAAVKSIKRPE